MCKVWLRQMFSYEGVMSLDIKKSLDYDQYWENKRQKGAGELSLFQHARADILLSLLARDTSAISVGDIGGGEGSILAYLAAHRSVSTRTVYDSSSFILDIAKKTGAKTLLLDLNDEVAREGIEKSDYFLLLEILEHLPDSEKVLETVFKKANKGVFFSFPNTGFFVYRLRLLFGKFPKQWARFPNEHLRFWTLQDLRWWLTALGYADYTIVPYKGLPLLNKLYPALFAAAFVVLLRK